MSALFIDFENVYYAIASEPHGLTSDAAMSATMTAITELRQHLRKADEVLVVERSYADWERLPLTAQRQLQISGILPRFTDSRVDKNTADIELSLDAMYFLLTRPELDHFVLVGGDRDYLPLLRRLKEHNRALTVCSFQRSLSGDVREFASNYAGSTIVELDTLVDLDAYRPKKAASSSPSLTLSPTLAKPTARPSTSTSPAPAPAVPYAPGSAAYAHHERYAAAMNQFQRDKGFSEIHLGPFVRWLRETRVLDDLSSQHQRQVFDELCKMGAVTVEDRDTGQGYSFSVAHLNWNHPLVRATND